MNTKKFFLTCNRCKKKMSIEKMRRKNIAHSGWVCILCSKDLNVVCKNCGKSFPKRSPAFNKKGTGCCSVRCAGIFKRKKYSYKCLICGKMFINNNNYDIAKKYKRFKFCSNKCKNVAKEIEPKKFHCLICGGQFERKYRNKYKYCSQKCNGKSHSGENSYLWKGGVTPIHNKIRASIQYKQWQKEVFIRDGYCCSLCGDRKKKFLVAHHIQNFAQYPQLRFVIENGITLCRNCHKEFHKKYGKIDNIKDQIEEFINRKL